jgi:hypothetical protein
MARESRARVRVQVCKAARNSRQAVRMVLSQIAAGDGREHHHPQ